MSRIEWVSNTKVEVLRIPQSPKSRLEIVGACLIETPEQNTGHSCWDAEGRAALKLVLEAMERDGDFSSLKPKPKYRPYTPVEAAAHLGRVIHVGGERYTAQSIDKDGIRFDRGGGSWMHTNYAGLVGRNYTWADTGERCGVLEE